MDTDTQQSRRRKRGIRDICKQKVLGFTLGILVCLFIAPLAIGSEQTSRHPNPQTAEQAIWIDNGRLYLDVQGMPLTEVLRHLGILTGIRFESGPELNQTVTASIQGGTVAQVLNTLCANRALVYEYDAAAGSYQIIAASAFAAGKKANPAIKERIPADPKRVDLLNAPRKAPPADAALQKKSLSVPSRRRDRRGRLLYLPGEILIRFKSQATASQIGSLHKSLKSTVLGQVPKFNLVRVRLHVGTGEQEAIDAYQASGLVEAAHRHTLRYPLETPDDPEFTSQWGLLNLQAPPAWNFSTGSNSVVVAVIDTGINYQHPDLAANIWANPGEIAGNGIDDDANGYVDDIRGWDFAGALGADAMDADADPMDMDIGSHGTHVAGIIGARGNNGIGLAGTAWTVRLMPLKVQADDNEALASIDIIAAVAYALDNGAHVVNCSYGGELLDPSELQAFTTLRDAGIAVICAAGNSGRDNDITPNYPSNHDLENIISVAAGTETNQLAGFSNYGATTVDLMAPGVAIRSTAFDTAASVQVGATDYTAVGMSYAGTTPAAGITALLIDCGKGYPADFPPGINSNVALIERGKCEGCADFTFSEKVANAQAAGAAAVIIFNNVTGLFEGTLATAGNWPPVVSVSDTDGDQLLAAASQGQSVTVKNTATLYGLKQGTSMAAPFVTGVAALLLAENSDLTTAQIKAAILNNVDKVPALAGKVLTGGKLNARFALCSRGTILGDISCNHAMGIEDAIMAIQGVVGISGDACPDCIPTDMDVNGDSRIGLEEAGYILQRLSGVREE